VRSHEVGPRDLSMTLRFVVDPGLSRLSVLISLLNISMPHDRLCNDGTYSKGGRGLSI